MSSGPHAYECRSGSYTRPERPSHVDGGRVFVGRQPELALFRTALAGGGAHAGLFVHGPGGIGKSTLLARFAEEARLAGRPVVRVDGHLVDPTPTAFEAAAARAFDHDDPVLLVDGFERCQGLDRWLRDSLLPRLAVDALVVIAGRRPPGPAWIADPGWAQILRVVPLGTLPAGDAVVLLDRYGVPRRLHRSLLYFANGYPLALHLAARVAVADGGAGESWAPTSDLIEELLDRVVGEVPSSAHRAALHACARLLATTEDVLRVALAGEPSCADADECVPRLFDWLRHLPFVEYGENGLSPHELIRDALEADMRRRDPEGYRAMHARLHAHLVRRTREAAGDAVLPAVAALQYLNRRGGTAGGLVTMRGDGEVYEDAYQPADRTAVLTLAEKAEGPESASLVDYWLDRQPGAFRVHRRSGTGEPVAFLAWLRLAEPDEDEIRVDPVVAAAWTHSRAAGPLRPGEHVAIARFLVHPEAYYRPSAVMDLMQYRVAAGFIRSERLAWSYLVVADATFWGPVLESFDQAVAGNPVDVGGREYLLYAHDWRAVPLEQWHERLNREHGAERSPRSAVRPAGLVALSRVEFDISVRDALRTWRRSDALAENRLTGSRLVAESGVDDRVTALRQVLTTAIEAVATDPRGEKPYRALVATYLRGSPSQTAAAARLGVPFSTYRRHLASGVERVCDRLWQWELYGAAAA
jgi:hypothetical protein